MDHVSGTGEIGILTPSQISLNLFMIGLVSASVQLLLMREVMNISGGYELVTGIFLGSWLIGSAIGAAFGGSPKLISLKRLNLAFSLSPLLSVIMLFALARIFLTSGETPSFLTSLIYTFLALLPFCLVSGFTLVKLILFARSVHDFDPGRSFSAETLGGVAAGILISFLTSGILNTYQVLLLIMLLSLSYVLLSFWLVSPRSKMAASLMIFILATGIILSGPDQLFRQMLLPGIKVTSSMDTPYGNISTGEYLGEKSTYYNQRLITYNSDVTEREENIQYAMLQSQLPEKVILISGDLNSQLQEILKYPVRELIFIERDPALAARWHFRKDTISARLSVINTDAFRYMRQTGGLVDVIILSGPPPSTLQLNRYYTTEFFTAVKRKLKDGGVFMCSPGPGNNYFNRESVNMYSSVFNSLSSVFGNVKPVSGNKLYFIASDKELSVGFCRLAALKKINNIYVSPDFLSDDLTLSKTEEITALMDRGIRKNSFSFPVASYHFQSFNFTKNSNEKIPVLVIMALLFATPLFLIKRGYKMMYFSASALAGFEIIILLTLQMIIGNMYQLTGLVLAGLMAGLALGAGARLKGLQAVSSLKTAMSLLFIYTLIGFLYNSLSGLKDEIPALVIIILSAFIPALLTGHLFHQFTVIRNDTSTVSSVYGADLAGSALGFILVTGVAIPVLGIQLSIFLLSAMIFAGILFGTIGNKL
ncbi:MAG: hypothetical protein IPN67_15260 [Bacteroidales bacterium]|nr:hypothetical protein [Bacteroidales bacterium]